MTRLAARSRRGQAAISAREIHGAGVAAAALAVGVAVAGPAADAPTGNVAVAVVAAVDVAPTAAGADSPARETAAASAVPPAIRALPLRLIRRSRQAMTTTRR